LAQADAIAQLHGQMRGCDELLSGMEQMLSVFQADLGSISAEIQVLQVGGWRGLGFGIRPFCLTGSRHGMTCVKSLVTLPIPYEDVFLPEDDGVLDGVLDGVFLFPPNDMFFLACLSHNQAQSLSMSEKLKNRQAVQNSLHKIVKELAIPPDMIEYVTFSTLGVGTAPFLFCELTRHIMNHFKISSTETTIADDPRPFFGIFGSRCRNTICDSSLESIFNSDSNELSHLFGRRWARFAIWHIHCTVFVAVASCPQIWNRYHLDA
jgi:hypothetical protein